MSIKVRFFAVLAFCCLILIRLTQPVQAAGSVTNCVYSGAGGLQAALAGGGIVTFGCSGTISVPLLYITQATTLDATGQTVILDANNAGRIFRVVAPLTLINLTLRDGAGATENGNAILNFSTVQIINSVITNNTGLVGGAILNANAGVITITNSTLSNNSGANGGAIFNLGKLTITNSTISGNTATGSGGAIYNNFSGDLTIRNTTISNNSAVTGGAIIAALGAYTDIAQSNLTNNSASSDGGALYQSVTGAVTNIQCTNITGNTGGGSRVSNLGGSPITARSNWWGVATGPGGVGPGTGDSVSVRVDFAGFLGAMASPVACPLVVAPTWTSVAFTPTPPAAPTQAPGAAGGNTAESIADTTPLCADLDGSTNPVVRVSLPLGVYGVYCDIIAENRVFRRTPAEVGVQSVLDRGVIHAVDVFSPSNASAAGVLLCLQGEGDLIFLDAAGAPRVPQALPVQPQDGFSCAVLPNVGTVVLVDKQ